MTSPSLVVGSLGSTGSTAQVEVRLQLVGHDGQRLVGEVDARPGLVEPHDEVLGAPLLVGPREVVAGVTAARLLALERGLGDATRRPAACCAGRWRGASPGLYWRWPSTTRRCARSLSFSISWRDSSSSGAVRMMPDQVVHRLLEVLLEGVRVLAAALVLERRQRASPRRPSRPRSRSPAGSRRPPRRTPRRSRRPAGRRPAGPRASCRRAGSSRACRRSTRRRRTGRVTAAQLGVGVDLDAAHHVVTGRPDLHRLRGDVDVGQLLELVVHRRQPAPDELGGHRATRCRGRRRRAGCRGRP